MSVVAFPLASHLWCTVEPVGWNTSTETTETACPANLTFFFGDTDRVLTDEQYLTDEEEVVEQVATFEEFFPLPAFVEGVADPIAIPGIVPTSAVPTPVSPIVPTPIYPVIDPTPWVPQDEMPEIHTTTLTQLEDPMPPELPTTPAPVPLPPALALVATGVAMLSLVKWVLNRPSSSSAV